MLGSGARIKLGHGRHGRADLDRDDPRWRPAAPGGSCNEILIANADMIDFGDEVFLQGFRRRRQLPIVWLAFRVRAVTWRYECRLLDVGRLSRIVGAHFGLHVRYHGCNQLVSSTCCQSFNAIALACRPDWWARRLRLYIRPAAGRLARALG